MVRKKDIEHLKKFKRALSRRIPIDRMYLFGSRAKGNPGRWSDFDIVVVSEKFKNKENFERAIGFHKYWGADYPVDFLCYTPEEFNRLKKQATIVREAVREGVEV